jgi:hypothetical protein
MSIAAAQKAFPTAKVTIYGAFGGVNDEKICKNAQVF